MTDARAPEKAAMPPAVGAAVAWAPIESSSSPARVSSASAESDSPSRQSLGASLRAIPLGTVVDEGGRIARRHGRVIFTVTSALLLPAAIAEVFAAQAVRSRLLDGQNPLGTFRIAFTSRAGNDAGTLTAFIGLGLLSLAAILIGAYVATVVAEDRFGRSVSQRAAVVTLVRRVPALVAAWVLTHAWVLLVFWAGQSSGGLAVLVAVAATPIVVLSTFVAPAMMLEHLGPWAGIRRSWRLARQSFGVTIGFVALSSLVGLWFRFGLALFPAVVRRVIFTDRFQWLVEGVGSQLGIIISTPIVACATSVMYIDVRTRTEGMDMFLERDRVLPRG